MSKENQTLVSLNISYDSTPLLTQAKKSIEEEAKKTLFMQIRDFFGSRQDRHFESATGNWVVTTTPGDGLRQIDEMVTKALPSGLRRPGIGSVSKALNESDAGASFSYT